MRAGGLPKPEGIAPGLHAGRRTVPSASGLSRHPLERPLACHLGATIRDKKVPRRALQTSLEPVQHNPLGRDHDDTPPARLVRRPE